jgi:hypothetical protein
MVIYKFCTNDLGDKLRLTLKIKEDIKFLRGLIVKQNSREILSLRIELISSVSTLEINTC